MLSAATLMGAAPPFNALAAATEKSGSGDGQIMEYPGTGSGGEQIREYPGGTVSAQGAKSGGGAQSQQGVKSQQGRDVSNYLSQIYIWFLGFVGIAALFAITLGGVMYMFSGANITKTEQARKWITNAIWGIILAAASFLILNTINPDLVTHGFNLQIPEITLPAAPPPAAQPSSAPPETRTGGPRNTP
ncbi:MAG: hypothetical protein HY474_00815 [Candidatus Sungbacteria bacterium]|uniref:DUF4190 domain-containing protein n=1 Tax=Candidatus Sungiibacteriota bacterium TaxID=2750080 RepID=A0A932YY64_9BACT|nr:hypothetical protein [Candidatus Sungbacteria bacterium]